MTMDKDVRTWKLKLIENCEADMRRNNEIKEQAFDAIKRCDYECKILGKLIEYERMELAAADFKEACEMEGMADKPTDDTGPCRHD